MSRAVLSVSNEPARAPLAEILLWLAFCVATATWALVSASAASAVSSRGLDLFVVARAGLSGFTVAVLAWRLTGGAIHSTLPTIWALLLSMIHVAEALSIGYTVLDADLAGATFLLAAVLYRGSARVWWTALVPVFALVLFLPLAVLESKGDLANSFLIRISLLPSLSLVVGALLAVLRDTRVESTSAKVELKALGDKSRRLVTEMKLMEKDLKVVLSTLKPSPAQSIAWTPNAWMSRPASTPFDVAGVIKTPTPLESVQLDALSSFAGGPNRFEQEPLRALEHSEVHALLHAAIDEARTRLGARSAVRIVMTAGDSLTMPLALRCEREALALVLRSLVGGAVDAFGGGGGIVRISLRPTPSHLVVLVEDNGRGLSEEMIAKRLPHLHSGHVSRENLATLSQIREIVYAWGGRFDYGARLGVGSRAQVDLLRVDGFATESRAASKSEISMLNA